MMRLMALVSGTTFGIGLAMSGMLDRERILGFLDLGAWDPTLAWVMMGAVGTTLITFQLLFRRRPFLRQQFGQADKAGIDRPLLLGAGLFGIGWGISGYCPGPGVALLAIAPATALTFLVGIITGSLLMRTFLGGARPAGPASCG